MKILVVGTGSVGIRHIRNLISLGVNVSAVSYRGRKNLAEFEIKNVKVFNDLKLALNQKFDGVVIANSSEQHVETAIACLERGLDLYIEKPVGINLDNLAVLRELAKKKGSYIKVGYMLRYHPNLVYLKKLLERNFLGHIDYARLLVGHWLPSWRPGQSYEDNYSATKATGGGVIFDLSHELDLAYWMFGEVQKLSAIKASSVRLNLETEALAEITLVHENAIISQIHLDYLTSNYRRTLEISGEKGIIYWDYTSNTVTYQNNKGHSEQIQILDSGFSRNEMFYSSMQEFIQITERKNENRINLSNLECGIYVLKLALSCHKSADNLSHILMGTGE